MDLITLYRVRRKEYKLEKKRRALHCRDFTIISNNCWGGYVYQHFGLEYSSPFIGLYLFADDYIRLLTNFRTLIEKPLQFISAEQSRYRQQLKKGSRYGTYPIGLLDDIEIHFLHYKTNDEALDKWTRRKKRINFDNLIIKFSEHSLAKPEHHIAFEHLEFDKKIQLLTSDFPGKSSIKLPNPCSDTDSEWERFTSVVEVTDTINGLYKAK